LTKIDCDVFMDIMHLWIFKISQIIHTHTYIYIYIYIYIIYINKYIKSFYEIYFIFLSQLTKI